MQVNADYFDGRSSRRHRVALSLQGGTLTLRDADFERRVALSAVTIPRKLGDTPRLILFADGGRCEIADHRQFAALLPDADQSLLADLESSWLHAGTALLITLAIAATLYIWGLPFAAEQAAIRVPDAILAKMDEQFFDNFAGQALFKPSTLAPERRQTLLEKIQALRLPPQGIEPRRIEFRSSPAIGANAFALPGGSMVILDELVNLTDDDAEILAVVAHEIGHVSERHALRQLFQASAVGAVMAWYIGDTSNLLAAAPSALLETRYSRNFEQQADQFAARTLHANGIAVSKLADILEKLERSHRQQPGTSDKNSPIPDYLSTHPNTEQRIKDLRNWQEATLH